MSEMFVRGEFPLEGSGDDVRSGLCNCVFWCKVGVAAVTCPADLQRNVLQFTLTGSGRFYWRGAALLQSCLIDHP